MLQESGLFELPEVVTDGGEFPVEVVQTSVSLQFSSKIGSSQFAPPCRLVRAASGVASTGRGPLVKV